MAKRPHVLVETEHRPEGWFAAVTIDTQQPRHHSSLHLELWPRCPVRGCPSEASARTNALAYARRFCRGGIFAPYLEALRPTPTHQLELGLSA